MGAEDGDQPANRAPHLSAKLVRAELKQHSAIGAGERLGHGRVLWAWQVRKADSFQEFEVGGDRGLLGCDGWPGCRVEATRRNKEVFRDLTGFSHGLARIPVGKFGNRGVAGRRRAEPCPIPDVLRYFEWLMFRPKLTEMVGICSSIGRPRSLYPVVQKEGER